MKKKLINMLVKMPEGFQKFVARKYMDSVFKNKVELKVNGEENLPKKNEPIIFICNHLSNIDGPTLDRVIGQYDPIYVAGQKLSGDNLTKLFIGIYRNETIKPDTPDKGAMKRIIKSLKDGESIVIFPEGTRSRSGQMIEGKRGIMLIARLSKAKIVPIAMHGNEKILPISKSGDMSSESINEGTININIGKPFYVRERRKNETKNDYDAKVMDEIMKSIANMLPEAYRGFYK